MNLVRPIRNEAEYDNASARLLVLFHKGEHRTPAETDEYEVLMDVVESYETRAHPLPEPSLPAILRFHMENLELGPEALVPVLGSIEAVTQVLTGHAKPSVEQLLQLSQVLKLPLTELAQGVEAA